MKSARGSFVAALRGRSYSAQSATKTDSSDQVKYFKISQLQNGTTIASVDTDSPVVRVAVVYNAGCRVETEDKLGITHCIRNHINKGTKNFSLFGIVRNLQQMGCDLTASCTRDHFIYSISCLRKELLTSLDFLGEVAHNQVYKSWEIDDNALRHCTDLALLKNNPQAQLFEKMHEVAFRDSLGNSLYMPEHRADHTVVSSGPVHSVSFTTEDLLNFTNKYFVPGNATVVGIGMSHDFLCKRVHNGIFKEVDPTAKIPYAKATYYGGEHFIKQNHDVVHAVIVNEGASVNSKDMLPLMVFHHIMGTSSSMKYGEGTFASRIGKGLQSGGLFSCAVSCLNMNYADSGIFGMYTVGHKKEIGKALKSAIGQFSAATKGGITADELQRGKNQLLMSILGLRENPSSLMFDIGSQVALTGKYLELANVTDAVNAVTLEDVESVAKKFVNGTPSMVTIGNVQHVPHLDQLL